VCRIARVELGSMLAVTKWTSNGTWGILGSDGRVEITVLVVQLGLANLQFYPTVFHSIIQQSARQSNLKPFECTT
jgi:hypothetical protein